MHYGRDPKLSDAHQLDVKRAEDLYPKFHGFKIGQRLVPERLLSGPELAELDKRIAELEIGSPERDGLLRAKARGVISCARGAALPEDATPCTPLAQLHPGSPEVPSLDLVASNLAAIRMIGERSKLLAESLNLARDPLMIVQQTDSHSWGAEITVLLQVPEGYDGARILWIDHDPDGVESYRRDADRRTIILPCATHREAIYRWSGKTLLAAPPNILALLGEPSKCSLVGQLAAWYGEQFESLPAGGSASAGMRLGALIDLTARVNGFERADLAQSVVLEALAAAGIQKKRANDGTHYMCAPKEPLKPIPRVRVQDIDAVTWDLFQQWRTARDTPARRARLAQEQAQREAQEAARATVVRIYGSPERRRELEKNGVLTEHQRKEMQRAIACQALAIRFVPLDVGQATPEWWEIDYEERVQRFAHKEEA